MYYLGMIKTDINMVKLFATCPKNLEGLLEEELIFLGAKETKQTVAGVRFAGDLELAYRVCLWSRLANRILLPLTKFDVASADDLYKGVKQIKWLEHLDPEDSILIDFNGTSFAIKNSHFGALKAKDAIVDQIRKATGKRPSIAKEDPDLRINIYLYRDITTVSIDLSGDSLHRRGYRLSPGAAPLKENLAAAILYRSSWLEFAKAGKPLLDPLCGSGTILIEAAMIVLDYAPGLLREHFGFNKWKKHDHKIWKKLVAKAKERRKESEKSFKAKIFGSDADPKAISIAKECIKAAGLEKFIDVDVRKINKVTAPSDAAGIIITNPPYGKRLEDEKGLTNLYQDLGVIFREKFLNWELALFTGNPEISKKIGIRPHKSYNFFNGTIPCKLLLFHITADSFWREYKN
jgi:23S rRNA (guanine2445-N2)-methyltransferase / 23S rRNA (guanine2069-N7)-methyltransferase